MNAIIVGAGKVGSYVAEQLSAEDINITVMDVNAEAVERVCENVDAMGVVGNGMDCEALEEAGVKYADFFIAVTDSDELNILSCLMAAEETDQCHTIARVRNPMIRNNQRKFIREKLGIYQIINPEFETAKKISQLLDNSSANDVETFAMDKVELLSAKLPDSSPIVNRKIKDAFAKSMGKILICAIERKGNVIIPDGEEILLGGDKISFVTSNKNAGEFFKRAELSSGRMKDIIIVGGGKLAYYLTKRLSSFSHRIKIIEKDPVICEQLHEQLEGKADIINGDGNDEDLLKEERIDHADAFISLTDRDEDNIMLSLLAKKRYGLKTITKLSKTNFDDIADELNIGAIINPKEITAEIVCNYIRSFENANDGEMQTMYHIVNGKAFAMEFIAKKGSRIIGKPLSELTFRDNIRLCCLSRNGNFLIPSGKDMIMEGDRVIVVAKNKNIYSLSDILRG